MRFLERTVGTGLYRLRGDRKRQKETAAKDLHRGSHRTDHGGPPARWASASCDPIKCANLGCGIIGNSPQFQNRFCTEAANRTRSMIFTISDSTVVFRFLRLIECYRARTG